MSMRPTIPVRICAPLAFALALSLAACADEPTYEADAEDMSGGELTVADESEAVPVDLPETEMTSVPVAGEAMAEEAAAE